MIVIHATFAYHGVRCESYIVISDDDTRTADEVTAEVVAMNPAMSDWAFAVVSEEEMP